MSIRTLGPLAALALLAACSSTPSPRAAGGTAPPTVETAAAARPVRVAASPLAGDLGPALAAFRRSCPALLKRTDGSGLTQPGDWTAPCAAAATANDPAAFFATLVPVRIQDGQGLNTGYYEPELAGSLTRAPGFTIPLYKRPPDLIEADLGLFADSLKGRKVRGRVESSAFVPYFDRAEIDGGALSGRGLELAWAADVHAAFFLEIQGSGRLRLPDGSVARVGYDGQNGRDYTAIGRILRQRGLLPEGGATMAGIIAWMQAQPDRGAALMHENRSKIFFRLLPPGVPGLGPPGALNIALTPGVSVAADPKYVPLGAPLLLDGALKVAQDTGGAIKGPNRLDLFQGAGVEAARIAGSLSRTGNTVLLLPPASAARLGL